MNKDGAKSGYFGIFVVGIGAIFISIFLSKITKYHNFNSYTLFTMGVILYSLGRTRLITAAIQDRDSEHG